MKTFSVVFVLASIFLQTETTSASLRSRLNALLGSHALKVCSLSSQACSSALSERFILKSARHNVRTACVQRFNEWNWGCQLSNTKRLFGRGVLECSCGHPIMGSDHSICGDNLAYAKAYTESFFRLNETLTQRPKREILKHNIQVGIANMVEPRTQCKCHGTSGSCTLRTCWHRSRPWRAVAGQLQAMFGQAKRIALAEINRSRPTILSKGLIYLHHSSRRRKQRRWYRNH